MWFNILLFSPSLPKGIVKYALIEPEEKTLKNLQPPYDWKQNCSIYRAHDTQNDQLELMVSTQKWVKKICTGSWDISQNVQKYAGLVWEPDFWHILLKISRPSACFQNQLLRNRKILNLKCTKRLYIRPANHS